jgi:catechol 2,3-dioxygenase-like lactoylglutathione lyase family enzyme
LPQPQPGGFFLTVTLADGATLQYAQTDIEFHGQHFAFLVSEEDFDGALHRIKQAGIEYWADPRGQRVGEYNTNHGGRGLYFDDPNGHHFEILTQPYGAAG